VKINVVNSSNPSFKKIQKISPRHKYLDLIRGIAFLGMVVYHANFFRYMQGMSSWYPWHWSIIALGLAVRLTFVVLVGVSSWFWFKKYQSSQKPNLLFRSVKRSLKVGLGAVLISVFSLVFFPNSPVYFGVLHMISFSVVVVLPFLYFPRLAWFFGLMVIFASKLLLWLEMPLDIYWIISSNSPLPALDYFPVIPWFGVVLLGVSLGFLIDYLHANSRIQRFYKTNFSLFSPTVKFIVENYYNNLSFVGSSLAWIGSNALLLYVIHLPLILFAIAIISLF
jgi:uncharacterized membrane protein